MAMRTNIVLDDKLVAEAMRLTGVKTKRQAVDLALRTLVDERRRKDLRELRGKVRFQDAYDPHQTRSR